MLLAIDTSGAQTSVSLFSEINNLSDEILSTTSQNRLLQCSQSQSSESHSSSLSSLAKGALSKIAASTKDLDAIALGAGPGSFTGLRIGFAFAKGMAVAANIPIYTFSSLAAAAWQYRNSAPAVLALDDARRGEFFAASFCQTSAGFVRQLEDQIISKEEVLLWANDNPTGLLVSANLAVTSVFPQASLASHLAVALGELAIQSALISPKDQNRSNSISQVAQLSPIYIRKVAAMTIEERKLQLEK